MAICSLPLMRLSLSSRESMARTRAYWRVCLPASTKMDSPRTSRSQMQSCLRLSFPTTSTLFRGAWGSARLSSSLLRATSRTKLRSSLTSQREAITSGSRTMGIFKDQTSSRLDTKFRSISTKSRKWSALRAHQLAWCIGSTKARAYLFSAKSSSPSMDWFQ